MQRQRSDEYTHVRSLSSPDVLFVGRKLMFEEEPAVLVRPPTPVVSRSSFAVLPPAVAMSDEARREEILRWQARIGELQAVEGEDMKE